MPSIGHKIKWHSHYLKVYCYSWIRRQMNQFSMKNVVGWGGKGEGNGVRNVLISTDPPYWAKWKLRT